MRRLFKNAAWLVETIISGAGRFLSTQWAQYNPLGQFLFVLAVAALAVDMGISWKYGWSTTALHAAGFALVAAGFCILPDAAMHAARMGRKGGAAFMAFGAVVLFPTAYQSHIGYSSAVRLGDIQQTEFSHMKLASLRDSESSEKRNLDMMRGRLDRLVKMNEDARAKNGGWVTSTDPIAAKKQLEAIDQKIENEAKRVKCGTKCEALKVERGNLAAYIENLTAEKDLSAEIAKLQTTIDKKSQAVANTGYASSVIVNQNDTFAKLFNLASVRMGWSDLTAEQAIQPTAVQRDLTNTAMAGSASLAFMILAPLLMAAAGFNRMAEAGVNVSQREDDLTETTGQPRARPAIVSNHIPSVTAHTTSIADLRAQMHGLQARAA